MSILKKLESEPYRAKTGSQVRERSFDEITHSIREKILESHANLVIEARLSRQKRAEIAAIIAEHVVSGDFHVARLTRKDLVEKIVQEICGLGPIDHLVDDPAITEIMINGPGEVFVEKDGRILKTDVRFKDERHLLDLINRIVNGVGRRVDRSIPYVDARLPDGSRVNAVIPPLALNGPVLTIRRFPRRFSTLDELVTQGTMNAALATFLRRCIQNRLDMVVSGGSGTGKTTTLNVLANACPQDERIIIIEDSSEIQLMGHHAVYLETRPDNVEGKGGIGMRDLLRNALRMRPDRIIIGECRGKETFDLILAMNTGHEGCLSTVHANSSRDCIARLSGMALMSDESVPLQVLESWIASALDIVIHMSRNRQGLREVSEVAVVGAPEGCLTVEPIFSCGDTRQPELPPWFAEKIGPDRWSSVNSWTDEEKQQ